MDLRKVCTDVRGAPYSCRKAGPARQSAMGVVEVQVHGTACLLGFDSLLPDRGASQWMILSSYRAHDSETTWQASWANSLSVSHPNAQTPGENAEHMDGTVVSHRAVPSQPCGMRASWKTDRQCREPARCCDCTLQFLFPHGSRPLPFLFRNARVEVGRTVMEG